MERDHDLRVKRRIMERNKILVKHILDKNYIPATVSLQQTNFPPRPTIVKAKDAFEFEFKCNPRRLRLVDGGIGQR